MGSEILWNKRKYVLGLLVVLIFYSSLFGQENLKICAIRVEFQPEENPLTTGDGRFMMDTSEVTPYTVDPPPHDRRYFLDQIIAVNNYYQAASKQNVSVSGQVFPLENNSAYQLPQPMGYYNPNTTEEENNQFLAQLFLDAIQAADPDPDIVFSDYDVVVIFHAGVGNDVDLGFDETPQDIPSLFMSFQFLRNSLGNDFDGVSVDNGQFKVKEALMLPETESQAGFELGITGIFAANIGSFLGLYDLFSPSTKRAGVGRFGLMDSGLFNMFGLVPSVPCAFSRELMGWDQPQLIANPQSQLTVSRFDGTEHQFPSILKVPINSDEYFLIEYRGDNEVNIDSLLVELGEGRDAPPTHLEVLKTYFPDRITVSDTTGVLLEVEDYDWDLPGAGILIWHIDQKVIREKAALNAINDDRDNRGVDLEEADGSQDIGYEYSVIEPGFNSELGAWFDFWFENNSTPLYKNEFSVSSAPNTRSNRNYAESHIRFSGFSGNSGNTMTFDYSREFFEEGFPVRLPSEQPGAFLELIVGNAGTENITTAFTADSNGIIFGVNGNGNGFLYDQKLDIAQFSSGSILGISLGDINADGQYDRLVAIAESGEIELYQLSDQDADSLLDTVRTALFEEQFITPPVVFNPYYFIGTESGKILRFSLEDGMLDSTFNYPEKFVSFTVQSPTELFVIQVSGSQTDIPPALIDLNSDGEQETVVVWTMDEIYILSESDSRIINLDQPLVSHLSFSDLDDDGRYEILFNTRDRIEALSYNGSKVSNFPIKPVMQTEEVLTGTPLIFDVDGDEDNDVVVVTSEGQVLAYNRKGNIISGFPTSLGGSVINTSVAENFDNDDNIELIAMNDNGELFAWQLDALSSEVTLWWNQSYPGPTNNMLIAKRLTEIPSQSSNLMPDESVYNYPNPNTQNHTTIRYFLKEDANVDIKIFDLAGDLVASFQGPGEGNVHNEQRWDLSDISSGVYLGRVEARSANDTNVKIIKIMVVK
jgi:M6 family metalloprotease-like protein